MVFLLPIDFFYIGNIVRTAVSLLIHHQIFIPAVRYSHMGAALCKQSGENPIAGIQLQYIFTFFQLHPVKKIFPDIRKSIQHLRTAVIFKDFLNPLRIGTVFFKEIQNLIAYIIHLLSSFPLSPGIPYRKRPQCFYWK